jgi:hypothetical protein
MKPNQLPTPESRLAARTPDGQRPHVMNHRWESRVFGNWPHTAGRIQPPKGGLDAVRETPSRGAL